jgi:hypothetical protein
VASGVVVVAVVVAVAAAVADRGACPSHDVGQAVTGARR